MQLTQRCIDCAAVASHNHFPALAIRFPDGVFNQIGRSLGGHDIDERKETRLHDRVGPYAELEFLRDRVGIDDVELQALGDNLLLDFARDFVPHLIRPERTVEQERGALFRHSEHIVALEESKLMDRNEICLVDQVGTPDLVRPKAKVGCCPGPGFLRIIDEVALRVDWAAIRLAVLAYDATRLVFDAIARDVKANGAATRTGLSAALAQSQFSGLSGTIRFNSNHNWVEAQGWVYQWRNGEVVRP